MLVNYATTKKGIIQAPNPRHHICYACDAGATGAARIHSGGKSWAEYACPRHADPTIKVTPCCVYCGDPTRKGSLVIDGDPAHQKCHQDACRS